MISKTNILLCLLALCFATTSAQDRPGWSMVWNDEFSAPNVDLTKWSFEVDCNGGGNNELQCYTSRPANAYIENGNLVLKAKLERYTGSNQGCTSQFGCTNTKDYTSARLRTLYDPKGSWQYGRFEIRAKLPNGKGLWPAFWMLPRDYSYGPWAASGEIDIMEYRGQETSKVSSTLHYGAAWPNNVFAGSGNVDVHIDLSADYHVYACEWETNEMRFYVDDTIIHRVNTNKMWYANDPSKSPYTKAGQPWDKPFHILLNLAIGGGFFNGYSPVTTSDAQFWADSTFRVDYVRVYQRSVAQVTTGLPITTGLPVTSGTGGSGTTGSSDQCTNCCCNCNQNSVYGAANNAAQTQNSASPTTVSMTTSTDFEAQLKIYYGIAIGGIVAGVALLAAGVVLLGMLWRKQRFVNV